MKKEAGLLYCNPLKASAALNAAITLAGTFTIYYAAVKTVCQFAELLSCRQPDAPNK